MEEIYYIYRHIRLDTNEVFYIGLGKVYRNTAKTIETYYSRAFQVKKRNRFWNFIVEKTKYDIEIIYETNNREDIIQKEIEFIALYGRRDLGKGTLVNLTDGGDGVFNNKQSEETIEKRRKMYAEGRTGLKVLKGGDSPRAKKVIEEKTGNIFNSLTEAANYLKITPSELSNQLSNVKNRSNKTGFKYLDDSLNKDYVSKKRNIKIYNFDDNSIIESISEASRMLGVSHKQLKSMLKGIYYNKTNMVYYEDFLNGIKPKDLYVDKKIRYKIINIETKEIFPSMMSVSNSIGFTKSMFSNRILGKIFNETPYQLLEDYEKGLPINWNLREIKTPEKRVIDIKTKKEYNSIPEASVELGINYNTLANYLNPKSPNTNLTNIRYLSEYIKENPNFKR